LLGVVSIAVGLIFGICLALIFKHVRFLTSTPIVETFMIFGGCYVSYFVSDLIKLPNGLEMSGIISLLTCGIVSAHYTYYNISPQGRQTTTLTFSFLGELAEAAVYSYVGIALYSTIPTWWSWSFIFLQLFIIFGGRIVGVLSTFYCCRLCFKKKTIKFNELLFITYAGMIRGAIAFALVLKIEFIGEGGITEKDCPDCYSEDNYELVVSTTLMLVMLTTLIFGTFMDFVQKKLVPPKNAELLDSNAMGRALSHSDASVSEYEEIVHPNEEKSVLSDRSHIRRPSYLLGAQPSSWSESKFVNWFVNFDERKLRPWLIRNYSLQKVTAQDLFDDAVSRTQFRARDGDEKML
jgi:NhaP-type Na+/H+ or K+/H+ antiporter